jgi:anti-sigma factor RsiW
MKEQLESNLLTKYAAGLMSNEETRSIENWLKQNPQYQMTLALIKRQVDALVNTGRNRY